MPPSLASLSSELLMIILQSLSSPRELYSAIAASSHLYRVFRRHEIPVKSAVLQNTLPETAKADLLVAYHAQRIWALVPEHNDTVPESVRMNIPPAIESDLTGETQSILRFAQGADFEQLCTLVAKSKDMPGLWDFYRKLERLISMFTTRSLSALVERPPKSRSRSKYHPLSTDEQLRLIKAFCQFDIYTCLFQVSHLPRRDRRYWYRQEDSRIQHTDPESVYIKHLDPWETEQMSCVGQFYVTLTEDLCNRIEQQFIETVITRERKYIKTDAERRRLRPAATSQCWLGDDRLKWCDAVHKTRHRTG
ncbi:hypothetical protein BJX70DRAFT_225292 [Aspergillus crustosus]